jgi:5'-nucleotidase
MTNKVILLIDMDGVQADWTKRVLSTYAEKYPDRFVPKQEDVTEFFIEGLFPEEHREDLLKIPRTKGFYASLETIPGSIEAMKDIEENCKDFIEPYICSAPELDFEDLLCHSEKAQWVKKILGDFWLKRMILTKDKTVVRGDYLIDDKPVITGAVDPQWKHIHLKQPYTPSTAQCTFEWSQWDILKKHLLKESKKYLKESRYYRSGL